MSLASVGTMRPRCSIPVPRARLHVLTALTPLPSALLAMRIAVYPTSTTTNALEAVWTATLTSLESVCSANLRVLAAWALLLTAPSVMVQRVVASSTKASAFQNVQSVLS